MGPGILEKHSVAAGGLRALVMEQTGARAPADPRAGQTHLEVPGNCPSPTVVGLVTEASRGPAGGPGHGDCWYQVGVGTAPTCQHHSTYHLWHLREPGWQRWVCLSFSKQLSELPSSQCGPWGWQHLGAARKAGSQPPGLQTQSVQGSKASGHVCAVPCQKPLPCPACKCGLPWTTALVHPPGQGAG